MKNNFIINIAALLIASASVFAAPNPASDFQYDLHVSGTGVVIQRYLGSRKDVEIPAVIEGFPVMAIGTQAFYNGKVSLTSVVIPDSVTSIGMFAFQKNSLSKVTLPKNLITIRDAAFEGCTALTTITIPADVTSIGGGAFSGCTALTTITIPAGVTSIGKEAFYSCSNLTTITLPEGVSVGPWAFANCLNLTTLNLPTGGVTFPKGANDRSNDAFEACPRLTLATRGKLKALGYEGRF